MKIKFTILCLLVSFSVAYSQQSDSLQSYDLQKIKKNIVKTNATAYLFRNINLTYERVLTKRISASASYSILPSGKMPFINTFIPEKNLGDIKSINVSYQSFTFEPRFYVGKRGFGQGFYIAPYYRYSKINISDYHYTYTAEGRDLEANISGNVSANSLGLLIGAQWKLGAKQNWVLDFTILGAHYGSSNGDLKAISNQTLSRIEQDALQKELNNLEVPFVEIDAKANENGATANIGGPFAGLRFGLSVGYSF